MTIVCGECGGRMGFVLTENGKKLKCNECGHVQFLPRRSNEARKRLKQFKSFVKSKRQRSKEKQTKKNDDIT